MPRMSKADAAVSLDEPEIEGRYAELGEYTVAFETHKADRGGRGHDSRDHRLLHR
jgi:hypothetical protein